VTDTIESTSTDASASSANGASAPKKKSGGLNSMLLADLKSMAGGLGIRGTGSMKKAQLVDAIKAAQSGGSNQSGQSRESGRSGRGGSDAAEAREQGDPDSERSHDSSPPVVPAPETGTGGNEHLTAPVRRAGARPSPRPKSDDSAGGSE
jgi:transcription termination factor Rho